MPRLASLFLLLLATACGQQPGPTAPDAAPQAEGAPPKTRQGLIRDFAGTAAPTIPFEIDPSGKTQTIADVLAANPGKPLLVNLWATWCAPCLKELPTLDALAGATKGKLTVLPLSQDMEGWQKVSKAFTPDKYPNLRTALESQTLFGAELKAQGLPLTILYGADGKEVWRYAGDRDWNSAESRAMLGVG